MARAAARPSEPGILTSRMTRSGWLVADEVDGLVAASGLPHHVVALVQEDLLEIEPDDGLVLGDDHTPGHGVRSFRFGADRRSGRPVGARHRARWRLLVDAVRSGSGTPLRQLDAGDRQPGSTTSRSSRSFWRRSRSAI